MILIPQIYLKEGRAVALENTSFSQFNEDAFAMARAMMEAGSDVLHIIDLNITPVGPNANPAVIQKIRNSLKLKVLVGGPFRAPQSLDPYIQMEIDLIVLDTHAYQQPQLVSEACKRYPDKIAVHIDVRDGHVTIPGWTVAANRTAFDYVEHFREQGVKTFFYSSMTSDERSVAENFDDILMFCKKAQSTVYCTNEISSLSDIERLITLGAPRLEGIILGRSLYKGRLDLRGANAFVADLIQDSNNEPTLQDM